MFKISIQEYMGLYLDKKYQRITNLSNFIAIINEVVDSLNWVGVYLYDGKKLYLGPFQGKAAVQTIEMGDGVCGTALKKQETIVVDDVHAYENHIACDEASKSELVIPLIHNKEIIGVLDIDSPINNRFTPDLVKELQKAVELLFDFL